MKRELDTKFYRIFIIPYVIILLICCLIGLFTYSYSFNIVEREIIKSNIATFNQTKSVIDQRFIEIENMSSLLSTSSYVQRLQMVDEPYHPSQVYQVLHSITDMYNYTLSNNFIDDFYIVFSRSELVISSEKAYQLDYFLSNVWSYKNYTKSNWVETFINTYHQCVCLGVEPATNEFDVHKNIFTYVHSMGNFRNTYGAVLVMIEEEKIRELLSPINLSHGGAVIVTNESGELLTILSNTPDTYLNFTPPASIPDSHSYEYKQNSTKMLVTHSSSDVNGWNYYSIQPKSLVVKRVSNIKYFIFITMSAVILLGIISIYLYSLKSSYTPLKKLIRSIEHRLSNTYDTHVNPFEYISQNIDHFLANEEAFQESLKEQDALMRVVFLENLYHGNFKNMNDLEHLSASIHLQKDNTLYSVALLQFDFDKHSSKNMVLAKTLLSQTFGNTVILHTQSNQRIVMLFQFTKQSLSTVTQAISDHIDQVYSLFIEQKIHVGIGTFYESILDINASYDEALNALQIAIKNENTCPVQYEHLEWTDDFFYYPSKLEKSLMNWVRSGNVEETKTLLHKLYRTNIFERNLSIKMQKLFLYELLSTATKLQQDTDMRKQKELMKTIETFHDQGIFMLYETISTVIIDLCDTYQAKKRSHNDILIEKIKNYIEMNMGDMNLGLTLVANKFNISEVYLSNFFKEQAGQRFSDYLETLRLQHACDLLINTKHPIKDIAEDVGYASSNTFCRAFKRSYKVSATQYRASNSNTLKTI